MLTPSASFPLASGPRRALLPRSYVVPMGSRAMGAAMLASRGAGKSRLLGRLLTYQDLLSGIPQVVIDPVGGTIDNLLDKITWLPEPEQRMIWERVRYVNTAGQAGQVVPWPIYYRSRDDESLTEISERFVELIRRRAPALEN